MSRAEFYQTKVWKRNRKDFALSKDCICERCHRPVYVSGISDESIPKDKRLRYIVHHKEYLNENNYTNDDVSLNWDNLELLCIDCHNEEHPRLKKMPVRKGLTFDELGNLVQRDVRAIPPYSRNDEGW